MSDTPFSSEKNDSKPPTPFSHVIGRSRFAVLLAVIAVLLVALSLFLLGTLQALAGIWNAAGDVWRGELNSTELTVEFLEIVSVMLKAVVFYIIGVGLYSLFIAPLNLTLSLGVETLSDLENKIVSVIVVIMGVTFLEHFVLWREPLATLQFGLGFAAVALALVLFQRYSHQAQEHRRTGDTDVQVRAQKELFEEDTQERTIHPDELKRGRAE